MYIIQNQWLLFHCCFIILSVNCFAVDSGCIDIRDTSIPDHRYDGALLESMSPVGSQQCRTMCRTRSACLSINYHRKQLLCELVKITTTNPEQLTFVPGYSFTHLNTTDVIQEICHRNSCPEQHICILSSTGNRTCVEDLKAVSAEITTATYLTTTTTTVTTAAATTMALVASSPTTALISTGSTRTGCTHSHFTFALEADLCYFVTSFRLTKSISAFTCSLYTNGRLVILDTAEKIQVITSIISSITDSEFTKWWIDGSRQGASSEFTWSTGATVSPTPGYDNDNQHDIVIKKTGEFYGESSNEYLPYICEEYVG